MPTDGTYYLMFEDPIKLFEPVTFDINSYTVTINWKKHSRFNYYYHEEQRLIIRLEKFIIDYQKKVVLEQADPYVNLLRFYLKLKLNLLI